MSIKNIFCFLTLALLFGSVLFGQEAQPLQTEYTYTFEPEKNIIVENLDDKEEGEILATDSLQMTITRRDMPLVNRLVRFVTTTPDIFTFENGVSTIEVKTDENGTVVAPININAMGRGVAVVHLIRITSTATNITHAEHITLNVGTGDSSSMMYFDNIDFAFGDVNLAYYLFPTYLFLAVILFFVIGYFRRLKSGKEYNYVEMYMIATLLGFSSIKHNEKYNYLMIVFFTIEIILFYVIIFFTNPMISIFLLLFALVSASIPKDRAYAVFFTLFAMMSVNYYISIFQAPFLAQLFASEKFAFINELYFLIPFFFILTAFLSNVYIPLILLSSLQAFFSMDMMNVHFSIGAILLAFILFIIKTTFNIKIPLFYKLNILKVDV